MLFGIEHIRPVNATNSISPLPGLIVIIKKKTVVM